MSNSPDSSKILSYGRALAFALRSFDVLEAEAGWFERLLISILRLTYRQRLRHFVAVLPSDLADAIFQIDRTEVL